MSRIYRDSHREFQRRFDTERLADRIEQRLRHERITDVGRPNCSYKGGDPGFVRVLDEETLVFPNYDGNGMYLSVGNLSENPQVGLLFIDLCSPRRLRINGTAHIGPADSVDPPYPGAQFVIRITVRELFPNCPRYIHQYQLVERSKFVPHCDVPTPVPAWKQNEWARAVLPAGDPAAKMGPVDT